MFVISSVLHPNPPLKPLPQEVRFGKRLLNVDIDNMATDTAINR